MILQAPIHKEIANTDWDVTNKRNIPKHPCYDWGVSRASCAICIFSSDDEIRIAKERAPSIVTKYIQAEAKIKHSFRFKKATKTKPERRISVLDIIIGRNQ